MATENHCDDPMGLQQQQEEEEKEEEEEEGQFDRMVREIGGRENIYLVGETDGEGNGSIFQELILELFQTNVIITGHKHPANGDFKSGTCRPPAQSCPGSHDPHMEGRNADVEQQTAGHKVRTVRQRANTGQKIRPIHCSVIIFIFRHEFLQNKANRGCMEKILKDVKARVKKARGAHQALLGLIRVDAESSETRESVVLLQEKLRSVFTKHQDDSIWAGHFIPKAADGMEDIKRNACRAVQASLSTGHFPSRRRSVLWPPHRWFRRGRREQNEGDTNAPIRKDDPENTEEGIPLQTRSVRPS